ncbi:MAG: formate--tetrahydrofolate ligase [Parvularculaceae bacterium]
MTQASDLEIARAAKLKPIEDIAARLDIPPDAIIPYGRDKAKISADFIDSVHDRPDGKLVLVTAITPTPAGEGKTTTSVGLGDGLSRIGKKTAICLREPSLGPCLGMKGGAAGGGYAQVVPMEDINLHFTGDMHAITTANNLLAAMVDNHVYWSNGSGLDLRRITWRRVVDMNDRALREVTVGLGGPTNGFPRTDGFDISVASEVMAIFCLSRDLADLQKRLGEIVIGYTRDKKPVRARDIKAEGAMTALLKDALQPNLVQTLEGTPAFVHGGPFANIAHGCNSLIATKFALKAADYVVTEAGFGADLGAEKFFDIACRKGALKPSAAVLVATVRALKMHGGVDLKSLGEENVEAVEKGGENLARHIENLRQFGVPVVVAVNGFKSDRPEETEAVERICAHLGAPVIPCTHWSDGAAGAEALARKVVETIDDAPSKFRCLYADDLSLWEKTRVIAQLIYRADDIIADAKVRARFRALEREGHGGLPICVAKTQYSFSTDPALKGAPSGYVAPIREVRLSAGAGFVVVICGDIMTMPGLPRAPAAEAIGVDAEGRIFGLS